MQLCLQIMMNWITKAGLLISTHSVNKLSLLQFVIFNWKRFVTDEKITQKIVILSTAQLHSTEFQSCNWARFIP